MKDAAKDCAEAADEVERLRDALREVIVAGSKPIVSAVALKARQET